MADRRPAGERELTLLMMRPHWSSDGGHAAAPQQRRPRCSAAQRSSRRWGPEGSRGERRRKGVAGGRTRGEEYVICKFGTKV
jgi:hypothetical protein